jgi:prohibitin 2
MKNPFHSSDRPYGRRKTTPEGEPLEYSEPRSFPKSIVRIIIPAIIGIIILLFVVSASVNIVDAGHRGVLLHFSAVDTRVTLDEGIHFVVPFRDDVVQMEVRTKKIVENAVSASKDLQDVSTQVALNYHLDPNNVQNVYQRLGFDYGNRVIIPAIQESVKQVTARFNAEELITKRETVKNQIEEQIKARLAAYNIIVDAISITEFQFSEQFRKAIEAKVAAEQRALQAQNDLRRIEIEAQQAEAKAVGEQKANIARAEGVRQSNVLQAEGESQAINIIDEQLRSSPTYLEWLKTQRWDGVLPLVTGGGEGTRGGTTPFIQIPTGGTEGGGNMTVTASR